MIDLQVNEKSAKAFLVYSDKKDGEGLIVLHAWWGLNEFIKQFCKNLAEEGFLVLAPDLYQGKVATSIPEAEKYSDELDSNEINLILQNSVDFLLKNPNYRGSTLSIIGFSLGASCATLNASSPVPGGESIIRQSSSPQSTSPKNCLITPILRGPRHITASSL